MKPGIRRAAALLLFGFLVAWICWVAALVGESNVWTTAGLLLATLLELMGFVSLLRAERPVRKAGA